MKTFVVVLAVCLVVVSAGITDEQKAKLKEYRASCVAETGIDEAVIENVKKGGQVIFDDKLNCFSACMMKKTGIMRPDGSIDEEVARSKMPEDLPKEKIDTVMNMCKVQVGKDSCETGGKVLGCLMQTKAVSLLN